MKLIASLAILFSFAALVHADVKLDATQQAAADKLKAKGALVMPLAADSDSLVVSLSLAGKSAGDADVALVKSLPKVVELNLANTSVTDAGLANISGLTDLTMLHLEKTAVTDAGLAHLKNLSNLTYLNLYNTAVTDAGLANLAGLKKLHKLYLWQTKVTDAGAAGLHKANADLIINRGEEAKAVAAVPPAKAEPAKAAPAKAAPVKGEKPKAEAPKAQPKPEAPKVVAGKPINKTCPVTGEEIDPANVLVYQGKTIAFCCDKCPAEFQKNPAKYVAKLGLTAPAAGEKKGEEKKK